ncbi:unnamed protein product [Closterium sp. Naga37s-1]|nr:unnamed protein product [Closterium sp. Naga37s-1]
MEFQRTFPQFLTSPLLFPIFLSLLPTALPLGLPTIPLLSLCTTPPPPSPQYRRKMARQGSTTADFPHRLMRHRRHPARNAGAWRVSDTSPVPIAATNEPAALHVALKSGTLPPSSAGSD